MKLKCLCISDIHNNFDNIKRLKTIVTEQKLAFNYILITGDFLSLTEEEQEDKESIKKAEKEIGDMLTLLELICPKVIYIGGNHEPSSLYTSPYPSLSSQSINLHKGFIALESNLYIAAIGGAVNAVDASSDFKTIIWKGFPYNQKTYFLSDEVYTTDLHDLFDKIDKDIEIKKPIKPKVVLMTHNGPYGKTSYSQEQEIFVYSGSIGLMKLIEQRDDIILSLHGHTHRSFGSSNIKSTTVFNSGALTNGRYSILDLERKDKNSNWEVKAIEGKSLD